MKRRELIKGLAAMSALTLLPGLNGLGNRKNDNLHFIGLGSGGTNMARHIQQQGIAGSFTCITWFPSIIAPHPLDPHPFKPYPFVPFQGFNHIDYEYPREFRKCTDLGRKKIPLTNKMKTLLSGDYIYVVLVGLGSFTGTSLIADVIEHFEERQCKYLSICSLPFQCEGRWRNEYAGIKMVDLKQYENVKYFDNNFINKYNNISISKCFDLVNEEIFRIFKLEFPKLTS